MEAIFGTPRRAGPLWLLAMLVLMSGDSASSQEVPFAFDGPTAFSASEADIVLVGQVLGSMDQVGGRGFLTVLVEELWKGEIGDTVTVMTTSRIDCMAPVAGEKVAVHARLFDAELWAPCIGGAETLDRARLGTAASRVLSQARRQALEAAAIQPEQTAPETDHERHVRIQFRSAAGILPGYGVIIGPLEGTTDRRGHVELGPLATGLYHGRVMDPDGADHTFLILVRCYASPDDCSPMQAIIPLDGSDPIRFTPFGQGPRLLNRQELVSALSGNSVSRVRIQFPPESSGNDRALLAVLINVEGRVDSVRLTQSSGDRRLDSASIESFYDARFQPAQNRGQVVPVWVGIAVERDLQR